MNEYKASQIHLINRPKGLPDQSHFEQVEVELTPPGLNEVLVRNKSYNLYVSNNIYNFLEKNKIEKSYN